jgi:chromosome partitioning protein
MKVSAFFNQKGGCSKTTSTINIGAGLSRLGKKVLLIDFDPQASLSCSLGIESPQYSIYNLLKHEVLLEEAVIKKDDNLSIIPATIDLSAFDHEFNNAPGGEFMLKKLLEPLTYDYIFIDCAPNLNLLAVNALAASNSVYIPVQTEFLALQGLGQLMDTLAAIKQRINPKLEIGGIIGTRYNRRKINKDVVDYLQNNFKETFKTVIRENVSVMEAPSFAQDIYTYAPDSSGAQDYLDLCKEIIEREVTL